MCLRGCVLSGQEGAGVGRHTGEPSGSLEAGTPTGPRTPTAVSETFSGNGSTLWVVPHWLAEPCPRCRPLVGHACAGGGYELRAGSEGWLVTLLNHAVLRRPSQVTVARHSLKPLFLLAHAAGAL